jgi:hypothetical protein
MNKYLFGVVLTFFSCNITHADDNLYWEELSDSSKSEVIKSQKFDLNVMRLYLHQITLSDDSTSTVILDTLCMPTDGNRRMLYFHILNETVRSADGALAEMIGGYCYKYVQNNSDYALEYFSKHHDLADEYITLIATELYYNDSNMTVFKQYMHNLVKKENAKEYLPAFLNAIEQKLNSIKDSY